MPWSYLHVEITQKIFMAGKFIVELGQGHMYDSAIGGPQGIFFATNTQLSF